MSWQLLSMATKHSGLVSLQLGQHCVLATFLRVGTNTDTAVLGLLVSFAHYILQSHSGDYSIGELRSLMC